MIGATKRWLRRNRNGLFIGAGVVGAGYLAGQYVLSKISEARERMSSEKIARENLRRRFEQNQTDCTFTVLALLPSATENILKVLPVEELTNELQQKRAERLSKLNAGEMTASEMSSGSPSMTEEDGRSFSSSKSDGYVHASQIADSAAGGEGQKARSRTQLWNELKINSLTRSFTLLYTLSLLSLFTRIQLNLLGRRNYLSSVVSLASQPQDQSIISLEDDEGLEHAFGNDFETNRRYLTFSWWLLHRGWKDLMENVKEAVIESFGSVNPREDLSQQKLSELTLAVRRKVEGASSEERRSTKWLSYLMPPRELEDYVLQESGVLAANETSVQGGSNLRHLLDETSDLIDSPSFSHVLSLLNNEAFSYLIDNKCAEDAFKVPPSQPATQAAEQPAHLEPFSSGATITPIDKPSDPKAKLATVLAVVSRQAHSIGNGTNPPNEYLVAMEQGVRELEAFAAVVYSSNFDLETSVPRSSADPTAAVTKSDPRVTAPSSGVEASTGDLGDSSMSIIPPIPPVSRDEGQKVGFEEAWGKAVEGS